MNTRYGEVPTLILNRTGDESLRRQIYGQVRNFILTGVVRDGSRLPSTRAIAERYGLSRTTVIEAFDLLMADGLVKSERGSGTFVNANFHGNVAEFSEKRAGLVGDAVSTRAKRISRLEFGAMPDARCVDEGLYAESVLRFPTSAWGRCRRAVYRLRGDAVAPMSDHVGAPALRSSLARRLSVARRQKLSADQIVILSDVQQALDFVAQILVDTEDVVAVGGGDSREATRAFEASGARIRLRADAPPAASAKILYVSRSLRDTEVACGAETQASELPPSRWRVEDDRREGVRTDALFESVVDTKSSNVIVIGSFGYAIHLPLRCAFLAIPSELVDVVTKTCRLTLRSGDVRDQVVLARFLDAGAYDAYLSRIRACSGGRLVA